MSERFVSPCPPPTPRECETLDMIVEECAEIIQRCTKARRFGMKEIQAGQDKTNQRRIAEEIGDLLAVLDFAVAEGIVAKGAIMSARRKKPKKLRKFMQTDAPDTILYSPLPGGVHYATETSDNCKSTEK